MQGDVQLILCQVMFEREYEFLCVRLKDLGYGYSPNYVWWALFEAQDVDPHLIRAVVEALELNPDTTFRLGEALLEYQLTEAIRSPEVVA